MSLKSFFDEKIKKMDWLDIGLIKWSCIFFGVVIAMLIPEITEINVWWFIVLFIVLAIRPFYRVYLK
jgi:hypothetical protein